jgi:peptide/nickel transport system ATP-binding protein
MAEKLLQIKDLRLHFRTTQGVVQAVDDISFDMDSNEAVAVIGESGCGKTSLIRGLLRLLPRNVHTYSGSVMLGDTDIMKLSEERFRSEVRWRRMSLVAQAAMNSLNPVIRVGEQVAEPLVTHQGLSKKEAHRQAVEVFRLVGVSGDFLSRYAFELSGGMRQRAILAMALITRPDLVVLDEPTSALDMLTQANIMNVLKGIKRDLQQSFIFITHDVATTSELSDRGVVMYAGHIVEISSAEQFYLNPFHPYSRKLMASVPSLTERKELEFIKGQPPSLLNPPKGCRFAERCDVRFDMCSQEPPMFAFDDGRQVKCWLYKDDAAVGRVAPASAVEISSVRLDAPSRVDPRRGDEHVRLAGVRAVSEDRAMQDQILLSVRGLRTWFELRRFVFARAGHVKAVDGVSFDLKRGAALAIVGESGSGKSTLVRTILGLYKPTGGEILFDGMQLSKLTPREMRAYRQDLGYVQQDPYGALPPFMSLRGILSEPMKVNGIRDKKEHADRIEQVLEEVKLTPTGDFLSKFPHMLSGGQQQRAVIARAMILRPKMIVADEPVSMLDASVRVEVLRLLRQIQTAHDLAVIYITHDLSTVRHFSERIFIMYAAKTVEKAPVESLIERHLHPYTQALLAAIPNPDPENAKRMRVVPPGEPPSLVHPRCPEMIPGLCDVEEPKEFEPFEGHTVECWLYRESGPE